MKKILFVTVFLVTLNAYSQKDAFVINSDISIINTTEKNIEREDNDTQTIQKRLTINTRLGYLLSKNNLEIGVTAAYGSLIDNSNFSIFSSNNHERKFITIQGGAYIRKYFPINNKFAFLLIIDYLKSKTYLENSDASNEIDIQKNSFILSPGFVYFVSKKIALTLNVASVGYSTTVDKNNLGSDTKRNEFHFVSNTSNINIGIGFYL